MISRREIVKRLVAVGLVGVIAPQEPIRKLWQLDRTMVARPGEWHIVWRGPEHMGLAGVQVAAYRDRPDLPLFQWRDFPPMPQREQYTSPIVFFHEAPDGFSPQDIAIEFLARDMAYADDPPIIL